MQYTLAYVVSTAYSAALAGIVVAQAKDLHRRKRATARICIHDRWLAACGHLYVYVLAYVSGHVPVLNECYTGI